MMSSIKTPVFMDVTNSPEREQHNESSILLIIY